MTTTAKRAKAMSMLIGATDTIRLLADEGTAQACALHNCADTLESAIALLEEPEDVAGSAPVDVDAERSTRAALDRVVMQACMIRAEGAGRILRNLAGPCESEDEAALLVVADSLDELFELLSDQLDDKAGGAPGE